jgi:hypothetical protein
MVAKPDEMRGLTFYSSKDTPESWFSNWIGIYIVESKGEYLLRLEINYTAEDWLFINQYIVKADEQIFRIAAPYEDVKRDYAGGSIFERYDHLLSSSELKMIEAVVESKEAVIRYNGDTYYTERKVSDTEKKAMLVTLAAFEELGSQPEAVVAASTATPQETAGPEPSPSAGSPPQTTPPVPPPTAGTPVPGQSLVAIRSVSAYLDYVGWYNLEGEVVNRSTQNITHVEILGSFYNASHQLVKTESAYVSPRIVEAGGVGEFDFFYSDLPEAVESYELKLVGYEITGSAPLRVEIVRDRGFISDSERYKIVGEVKNQHDFAVEWVLIFALCYDSAGDLVAADFASTDLDTLEPGQISTFDIILVSAPREIDHYILLTEAERK